ncbi:hypothetical protein LTR78_000659 [Recurvomyces mirabilis]|uniref:Micro-fibrillar-associated protein 1 C-terminal domain-containing protein n=1 Tax=Recurvomyces mirabilis TaxID=574656 RepID=A0AAE0WYE9_9PEZI|nr:hypothetical protein LTR78_000659 [Recurvomyces mirabilis]KAK5162313.1 hypothetical protein LTS14_000660 [Recurvomyces mirabilis]
MPPPSSRMTKNTLQPTRYRPGKAEVEPDVSEDESEEDDEAEEVTAKAPAPKASSFPSRKLAVNVTQAGQRIPSGPAKPKPPEEDLEGFVTASESSEDEGGALKDSSDPSNEDDEDESSEEEDSSSDDEPAKPMLRPTFISKAQRAQQGTSSTTTTTKTAEEQSAETERIRKEKADELLQAQLEKDAAAKAAGRKAWDDDAEIDPEDAVDDTDALDPEAELAAWKLRELKRVRRDRAAIEGREKEKEEIERRRNLSVEEREQEDKDFLSLQQGEREGRGKMAFMQKYFHKGAFFSTGENEEDEEVKAVLNRDLAGARFEDETGDKSVLPEYMRIRDMTKLGKKGRTRYKDLRGEDTGRWGMEAGKGREMGRGFEGVDERFRPDDGFGFGFGGGRDGGNGGGGREQTGANSAPLGERRRREGESGEGREGKRARFD